MLILFQDNFSFTKGWCPMLKLTIKCEQVMTMVIGKFGRLCGYAAVALFALWAFVKIVHPWPEPKVMLVASFDSMPVMMAKNDYWAQMFWWGFMISGRCYAIGRLTASLWTCKQNAMTFLRVIERLNLSREQVAAVPSAPRASP